MTLIKLVKNKWNKIGYRSFGGYVKRPGGYESVTFRYSRVDTGGSRPDGSTDYGNAKTLFSSDRKQLLSADELSDWYVYVTDDAYIYADLNIYSKDQVNSLMRIGDIEDGNYTEIESDGTIVAKGNATVWDDVVTALIGRRLYSTTGKLDFDWDENAVKFQPGGLITDRNDRLLLNYQYMHGAKSNGEMRLHAHWEQTSTDKIVFTVQYRIQSNGQAKTTDWTTVTANSDDNNVYDYPGSGTFNNIIELAHIDMTGAGISATVDLRIARTDTTADNILVKFIDVHQELDTNGSHSEYVK